MEASVDKWAGQQIRLVNPHTGYQHPVRLLVKPLGGARLALALADNPISHLVVPRNGQLFLCGAAGDAGTVFVLEQQPELDGLLLRVESVRDVTLEDSRRGVQPPRPFYLGVHRNSACKQTGKKSNSFEGPHIAGDCKPGPKAAWRLEPAEAPAELPPVVAEARHEEFVLSQDQRAQFGRDGYLVVPHAMPARLVELVKAAIDRELELPGGRAAWDQTEGKACRMPEALALWGSPESPALTLVESLVGANNVAQPIERCQVALRFPTSPPEQPPAHDPRGWHVDGTIKGVHSPFSLLVGVALSDVEVPFGGGLVVFPGTHLSLAEDMKSFVDGDTTSAFRAKPPLEGATELRLRRGDVVLAHQKLCHNGAPNYSDRTRYCVYFRITHSRHQELQLAALDDPLLEFEGLG